MNSDDSISDSHSLHSDDEDIYEETDSTFAFAKAEDIDDSDDRMARIKKICIDSVLINLEDLIRESYSTPIQEKFEKNENCVFNCGIGFTDTEVNTIMEYLSIKFPQDEVNTMFPKKIID